MTEEMSVERKLLPSNKSSLKNVKNSDSSSGQNVNNSNRRNSAKDVGFFKDRSNRETPVADSDSRWFGGAKNSKNFNKRGLRNGTGYASNSEVRGGPPIPADVGSVFRPGSKKAGATLDELVNFNFGSQRNHGRSGFGRFNNFEDRRHFHSFQKMHGSCYNKEQFLLANCQFVVKENFDYSAYLTDPDLLVDWDCIEEVRLVQPEPPSCPICLYPPVAAQITRCGHVFCWPCVLHYLSLSDKQWRKCPICFESVHKSQLRSCRAETPAVVGAAAPVAAAEGARVALRLMRRERGSNVVAPASAWNRRRAGRAANLNDEFSEFAKLLIIKNEETKNIVINREKDELKRHLDREKGAPECCFIVEALDILEVREAALVNNVDTKSIGMTSPTEKNAKQQIDGIQIHTVFEDAFNDIGTEPVCGDNVHHMTRDRYSFEMADKFDPDVPKNNDKPIKTSIDQPACVPKKYSRENSAEKSYYFYQAENGQPIFMHPLNVHCLIREYGGLEKAPDTVTGIIAQMETFTMGPEIRKHYRYLGHLPSTSVFSLVEIEFEPDQTVVSLETLSHFADDFAKRHFARQRKAKSEQQQQKRCQQWEKAMLLNSASRSYSTMDNEPEDIPISTFVQSAQHEIHASLFSSLSLDHYNAQISPFGNDQNPIETRRLDVSLSSSLKSNESNQLMADGAEMDKTPSFAQMLKCGKPKTPRPTSKNPTENLEPRTSRATLEDEYAPSALSNYRHEFGDALQAAFDSLKSHEDESVNQNETDKTTKAKKKKKGKILFTL